MAISELNLRRKIRKALLQAPPSEAEETVRREVIAALADEVEIAIAKKIAEEALTGINASQFSSLIGGTIEPRAEMYSQAIYATFENNVVNREMDEGVTLGRRVLEAGDNCEDCIAAATEEFVPLDQLPEIGDSVCMSRCRCEFEFGDESASFRTSEVFSGVVGGQDAYGGSVEIN